MRKLFLAWAATMLLTGSAGAAEVQYVLETPGVTWGGSSAKARAAVESLDSVKSVDADMNEHTVTVAFDDEVLSIDDVVAALTAAGYAVPDFDRVD